MTEPDWEPLFAAVPPFQDAELLWMADAPSESAVRSLTKRDIQVKVTAAGPLLQREMMSSAAFMENLLAKLKETFNTLPDLWLSRISEPNFATVPWFALIRFSACRAMLDTGTWSSCIAIAGSSLCGLLSRACSTRAVPFGSAATDKPRSTASTFWFLLRCWFRNLRTEVLTFLATRKVRSAVQADHLIYARFPANWSKNSGAASYRYSGLLPERLASRSTTGAYLVTLARKNALTLKPAREAVADGKALAAHQADLPSVPVEQFGSITDLLISYFYPRGLFAWLAGWKRLCAPGALQWQGTDIGFLFREKIWATLLLDWPNTRYLAQCTQRALIETGTRALTVPLFELVEGRAVVRAAHQKQARAVGVQHGSGGWAHRWRIMSPAGSMAASTQPHSVYAPHAIGVDGSEPAAWLLQSGYPETNIHIIGAVRQIKSIPDADLQQCSRTVLTLGDLHMPETLFRWVLQGLSCLGYALILRPHPSRYKRTQQWLAALPEKIKAAAEISPPGTSLEEELSQRRPACLLAGCTGAAVDVARAGWPIVIILSNWLPDYSPLTAVDQGGILSSGDPAVVSQWIQRLHDDRAFRSDYSRSCSRAGLRLINAVAEESAEKLAGIISMPTAIA